MQKYYDKTPTQGSTNPVRSDGLNQQLTQIGNDQYIFYMARTTQHDTAGGASYILKAKIKYNTIGVPLNVSA